MVDKLAPSYQNGIFKTIDKNIDQVEPRASILLEVLPNISIFMEALARPFSHPGQSKKQKTEKHEMFS